ncbi:MAG: peptide deformylase [Campylobacterales bacterium]|nr:peptide deformylase [Campylobacterales bacterium]
MQLPIVTYPDKRLKQPSRPVELFDEALHAFLDDMYETMIASNGIGLAAIQVANPVQVLIINIPDEQGEQDKAQLLEIINPQIILSDGKTFYQEGCLSVPGFYEDVERFKTVTVSYRDRHGNEQVLEADGLLSVAVQHEMDHLAGKLFIEKLTYTRRKKFEKEYKRIQKEKKGS